MNPQIWWFLSRASGTVAWFLLTVSVLLGILLPAKMFPSHRPAWITDLHRWVGGLTVTFLAFHLAGLAVDSYVDFGWKEIFVPFASEWKQIPVTLGVVSFWLMVMVQVSSLIMRRLSRTVWRRLHLLSYPTFALTSLHGTLAGTDASSSLYAVSSIAAVIAVVFTTIYRVLAGRRRTVPRQSGKITYPPQSKKTVSDQPPSQQSRPKVAAQ